MDQPSVHVRRPPDPNGVWYVYPSTEGAAEIIAEEAKALSDTQLAERLAERGHKVARRTVAKYRSMEGILPAHLRSKSRNGAGD